MHVLYARDTVDESIFDKHDWKSELANAEINHYVWEASEESVDGEVRPAKPKEIPTRRQWNEPEVPDANDLERGDQYTGPNWTQS
jgi:hypothetical protein